MADQSTARASAAAQAAPNAAKNEEPDQKASPPVKPAAPKPTPAKSKSNAKPAAATATAKKPAPEAAPAAKRGQVVDHPALGSLTVKRAKPRRRHYATLLSFVLAVLLPSAATVGYLYTRAADQYASSVAFSVRNGESMIPSGVLGMFAQQVSSAGADAEIVYEFVRSQKMIEAALAALPLEVIYNRPERDYVFRLGEAQPVEEIVDYWNWMTDISFDPSTGIVRFEARAFTAEDAQRIADFVLAESTRIVNELSEQAREDAIRVANIAVTAAEERLREARRAMREFRNLEQEIDPAENASAKLSLVAALEQALAETRVELNTELQLVGERSPKVSQFRQRIASLEKQIADERARLGAGTAADADAERRFANVVSAYEERQVDLEFAQNAYTSALAAFEAAQIEARRQSRFLAPHIEPTLSVAPQYPQRALLSLAVFGLLTAIWAVLLLIVYNVRERH